MAQDKITRIKSLVSEFRARGKALTLSEMQKLSNMEKSAAPQMTPEDLYAVRLERVSMFFSVDPVVLDAEMERVAGSKDFMLKADSLSRKVSSIMGGIRNLLDDIQEQTDAIAKTLANITDRLDSAEERLEEINRLNPPPTLQ